MASKERSMQRRFLYFGITLLVFVFVCVTALMSYKAGAQAQSKSTPTQSVNGLPLSGPVRSPVPLPMLTRDQLVTHGNADDKAEIADLFYAYIFYHDSHNGPGVASLFTDDGILETLLNNGGRTFEPNAGPHGLGCIEYGHDQISAMFGTHALPFPGHSHNQVSNVMIQVHGDIATLYANWTTIRSNDASTTPVATPPNTAIVSHNGEYVSDLRRTPDGWRFVHHRAVEDEKAKFGIPVCEANVIGEDAEQSAK
jgi:ketosteroid isomerase-like protein